MRIVCPSCSATFEVPKTRLAAGQVVRCARCGKDWTPLAEPPPAMAAQSGGSIEQPPPLPRSESVILVRPAPAAQAETERATPLTSMLDRLNLATVGEPALIASWAVSIVALIGLIWAAVAWRNDVMHAWPPSERLYTALGLPADR